MADADERGRLCRCNQHIPYVTERRAILMPRRYWRSLWSEPTLTAHFVESETPENAAALCAT